MTRFSRKLHKWLMAFLGIQFLIWSVTGLYMVTMDIHFIHGESLVNDAPEKLSMSDVKYPISALLRQYPAAYDISLVSHMGAPEYRFRYGDSTRLRIDARTGRKLNAIDEEQAREIAINAFAGTQEIASVQLISNAEVMPPELSPRLLPVWQVVFQRFDAPTLYISEQTGQVVTRRHAFWRLFDWMWRFHIMDYDDGENVANSFLFIIALFGAISAFAGGVLTYKRFAPSRRRRLN